MRSLVNVVVVMILLVWSLQPACSQSTDNFEKSLQKLKNGGIDNFHQMLDEIVQQQMQLGFDTAKANLESILQVCEKFSDKKAISHVLRELGELHKNHQHYADSYTYFEEALKVAETADSPYELAKAKGSLGMLMLEQFKFDEGIVYYLEAADLFKQHGFSREVQDVYMILGNAYYRGRDFHNAIRYYKESLHANLNRSGLRSRMWVSNSLGLAYNHINWLDSSLSYYAKALEIAHILPDSFYIGLISGNTGNVYIKRGEYNKAIESLHTDIHLSKQYEKEWKSAAAAMASLAKVYQKIGDEQLASIYLDSAMTLAQKQYDIGLMIIIYEAYVNQYKQQDNYQKAFEYLTQVMQLRDSLNSQIQTQRAAEIDAAYSFDKNMAEISYLQKNSKLQRVAIGVFSVSTLMLFIFSFVLSKLIRHRTQANQVLAQQKKEIEEHNNALQIQKDKSLLQNKALENANGQISMLNKKLEEKVRFSEEILRSAYENANEAYFIMRAVRERKKVKDFVCLDVNQAAEQMLSHSKEELLGERILSILPFLGEQGYLDTINKVFEENIDFEQDIYLGEGKKFPVWVQISTDQIEGGVAIKIKDITHRKVQEQKLKTSEANISAMINNTTDLIISIDAEYRFTEFNEPFVKEVEKYHGFTPQRGQSIFDTIHEVNLESSRKNFDKALLGERISDQYEIPVNEHTVVFAEAFFSPILLEEEPIGATIVIRNITDRKNDEINLKTALNTIQENEKFLNEIIENLPVGMQIYDAQGSLIRMNGAQMEMLGITEVSPGQINALKEPFYKAYGIDNLFEQAYQGNTLLNREIFIDKGNPSEEWEAVNNKMWLSVSTIPIHNAEGTLRFVIGMFSDITERKEAEMALKESEEQLRTVINNSPVVLWTTNKDGIFTMSEGKALEKMAVQPGQLVGISIFDLLADYEDQLKLIRNVLENGIPYESTRKMGNVVFNVKTFPQRDEKGEIIGLIGTSIDVTERIEYEEKLKQSESNLYAIINNTNYAIWSVDTELRVITINETFKIALKLAFGLELKVGESIFKAIPESEHALFRQAYAKVLKGTPHTFEYSFYETYYEVLMNPIITDRKVTGVAVFTQDITERKKTQQQLIESEERLSLATKTANVGIWELDVNTSKLIWNDTMKNMFGAKNGEDQTLEAWDKYFHPEDIDFVKNDFLALLQSDEKQSTEFRICRPDGETRYIKGFAQVHRNQQRDPEKVIGVNLDITEQKENEEKLKQQHQEIIDTNKKIADYKLMALRSVMNPHFLFNSLNSIQFFIAKNEREQALNYLSLFSKLIRGVLNSSVNATISLAQELEILKYYIELEALRFENKFETEFVISDDVDIDNLEIPSLLMQPYVENAIIHGLYNKEGRGNLTVSISQNNNLLKCVVEDNGVGRKEAKRIKKKNNIQHKSVGMMVTKERLGIINKTNKVSVKINDLRDKDENACGTRVEIFIQL